MGSARTVPVQSTKCPSEWRDCLLPPATRSDTCRSRATPSPTGDQTARTRTRRRTDRNLPPSAVACKSFYIASQQLRGPARSHPAPTDRLLTGLVCSWDDVLGTRAQDVLYVPYADGLDVGDELWRFIQLIVSTASAWSLHRAVAVSILTRDRCNRERIALNSAMRHSRRRCPSRRPCSRSYS